MEEEEEEEIDSQQQQELLETPLPWKPLLIVFLMFIADSFSFNTLAPYITNMVTFLGLVPDGDKRKIGTWAGIIASSYFVTQFFSAIIWGTISDRYGRKPVLLVGIAGGVVTTLMFGFSTSIYMAVGSRALLGLLNGNLGVFKVYLAEISDKTNQAKVFSFLSGSFAIGSVIGPLIGAGLADPLAQFPWLKNHLPQSMVNLLEKFPYLPPNLFLSTMNILALVLGFFYLKESHRRLLLQEQQHSTHPRVEEVEFNRLKETMAGNENDDDHYDEEEELNDNHVIADQQKKDREEEEEEEQDAVNRSPISKSPLSYMTSRMEYILQKLKPENEIFTTLPPLIIISMYAIQGASGTMFSELMPLFLVLKPEDGGLNFIQTSIGILNAVSALLIIVWVFFFNPRVIKKLGCLKSYRIASLCLVPCLVLFPLINYLYSTTWLMWICLLVVYVVPQALYQILASSTAIMTNNSITSANMGKLNGIGQSAVAFTRAIGPSLTGFLFSWYPKSRHFPIQYLFCIHDAVCNLYSATLVSHSITSNDRCAQSGGGGGGTAHRIMNNMNQQRRSNNNNSTSN